MESLEDFYKRKFDWIPDNLKNEIGHFNLFNLELYTGENAKPVPYQRRDFYKVMLVIGGGTVHYADNIVEVKNHALSFSNPQIPYKWEHTERIKGGIYCIFDRHFFDGNGSISNYPVFQPGGTHIFELDTAQSKEVDAIFKKMEEEIQSQYEHKYDVLRNLVRELVHYALKIEPSAFQKQEQNAAQRISTLFMELLERQFPIDEDHRKINLRTPSDFANQLNIHTNHLNRAIRDTTQKTTTTLITERLVKEAKVLLRHSNWDISEIAYALDFKEPTHFSNFFKKHVDLSPSKFRSAN